MTPLIEAMVKAVALLEAHGAVPSSIKVKRSTFEALKRECLFVDAKPTDQPNSFMGIRIEIDE